MKQSTGYNYFKEIKEGILSAYDQYIDKEEFPMDTGIIRSEFDSITLGDTKANNFLKLIYNGSNGYLNIVRQSPIIIDETEGTLNFSMEKKIKTKQEIIEEESIYEIFFKKTSLFFKLMMAEKYGYDGEIIRKACNKFMEIQKT